MYSTAMPRWKNTARLAVAFAVAGSWIASGFAGGIDFNRDVRPILSEKCFACHGPDEGARKSKLRLDVRAEALKDREGFRPIVPGAPAESDLIVRIQSTDPDEVMPPPKEHHTITPAEVATLTQWVKEGAAYAPHWSFAKPVRPAAPTVQGAANPIDAFIMEKLGAAGIALSPEAGRNALIRRLSFDLTGLPATPKEVEGFVGDAAADAYEKLVDRLLASPHYGERWAKMWMDLARYADSTGYGSDQFRMNVWPWRDWVIEAFNRNAPYDRFTIEQLAGDLLPDATTEQISATAFNRNTMTNVEGGTDDEEYRVAAVKDRVATTMQVWMGLTAQCAQCHSHKFDPISQREYYELFAVFNQSEDADRADEAPRLPLPTPEQKAGRARLEAEIAATEKSREEMTPEFEAELHAWEADMARPVEWQHFEPASILGRSESSGTLLRISGPRRRLESRIGKVTALRLESSPAPESQLPNRVKVTDFAARIVPRDSQSPSGRFIRVTQNGEGAFLMLAEVEAFSGEENVAPKGKASASSTDYGGTPERANDGKTDGRFFEGQSVFHSKKERDPWWEVDLGELKPIDRIALSPRTDAHPGMLKNLKVELLDATRNAVAQAEIPDPILATKTMSLSGEKIVPFVEASADLELTDAGAEKAIDSDPEKTGWAFTDEKGGTHEAIFRLKEPVVVPENADLVFDIRQDMAEPNGPRGYDISITRHDGPVRALPSAIRDILGIEPTERDPQQRQQLADYFRPLSKMDATAAKRLEELREELKRIKPVELPIMRELPADKRRPTFVLNKGSYLSHGEEVGPRVPSTFLAEPEGGIDRLALARWLVSRDNPLTARVTVNRFWARLFGTGLVESEEDFGTQGSLPSHPELLDWLAVEFMDGGWDMKKLLKLMVTSRTYRQTARVLPVHLEKDPRNRLLAHFPRRRLDAEAVRDQALMLSGLLTPVIGGPSVYPPQPAGLWQVAFNGGQNAYPTSTGPDRWRRGIYTFWRRTRPNPTQSTFDAPSRETCTLRRSPTNTPLQAFVTLNDPVFVECAQSLARRIVREGGDGDDARLRFGLTLCLGRPPGAAQIESLRALLADAHATYTQDLEAAEKLATDPLGPLPEGMDVSQAAAWTVVANVLLNMDSVLTPG